MSTIGSCSRMALASLALFLAGCDCNGSTPVQPDQGTPSACPGGCAAGTYCCKKTLTCEAEKRNCTNVQTCPAGQELTYPAPPYMDENLCESIPLQCSCQGPAVLKPGMVGRFSALAATSGTLMASAYESSFGDLVLATVKTDSLDTPPTLEIVDGVPDVPPTKPVDGWRGGVEEPGDDVGHHTAIVAGSDGEPMIAYHDVSHRSLKLARRSAGKWATHVVDAPKGEKEQVGRYTAMLLEGGKPAIAYLALNVAGAAGVFNSELRWAVANSATPSSTTDWTLSVIESKAMSCQNLCASTEVCVLKTDGSSSCQAKGSGCPPCPTGEACVAGSCKAVLADTKLVDIPVASGLWPAVTSSTAGPVVVYYDRIAGRLRGAVLGGTTWKKANLAGSGSENVGAFPAVASGGGAQVHVTYQDASQLTLKYLQLDAASLTAGSHEVVDDGARPDGAHPVGADSALVLDAGGAPRVVYQDALRVDLLAARRSGPGQWTPKVATDPDLGRSIKGGAPAYGFYSALVLEGGQVYGSTFYYDLQLPQRGGLSFFKLP